MGGAHSGADAGRRSRPRAHRRGRRSGRRHRAAAAARRTRRARRRSGGRTRTRPRHRAGNRRPLWRREYVLALGNAGRIQSAGAAAGAAAVTERYVDTREPTKAGAADPRCRKAAPAHSNHILRILPPAARAFRISAPAPASMSNEVDSPLPLLQHTPTDTVMSIALPLMISAG